MNKQKILGIILMAFSGGIFLFPVPFVFLMIIDDFMTVANYSIPFRDIVTEVTNDMWYNFGLFLFALVPIFVSGVLLFKNKIWKIKNE